MNIKEVKQRIQSVKSTQKITSAMKLVSAAKLRRAQAAIEGMRPYQKKLDEMLSAFFNAVDVRSPYTDVRDVKRVAIIAVSSNSSLCGGFNANIIRETAKAVDDYRSKGVDVELFTVGKKITDAVKKMKISYSELFPKEVTAISYFDTNPVATSLMNRFIAGDFDRIELLYTHFYSAAKQLPVRELFLPIDINSVINNEASCFLCNDYIIEPSKEELLHQLLPKVIVLRLFTALHDSVAAEHAARMMAMQIATDNANDLINELVREYNKGRQQAITNELLDIVSGSMN